MLNHRVIYFMNKYFTYHVRIMRNKVLAICLEKITLPGYCYPNKVCREIPYPRNQVVNRQFCCYEGQAG